MRNRLITSRRSFLAGSAALLASPSVVRAAALNCAPYIGPVATGCALADTCTAPQVAPTIATDPNTGFSGVCQQQLMQAGATSLLSRSPCFLRDSPPWIQIVLPTWYVDFPYGPNRCSVSNEINAPGVTITFRVAIEWEVGSTGKGPLTAVKFGGQTTPGSVAGGINFVSDHIVPPSDANVGKRFWVWIYQYNPYGVIYRDRQWGLGDTSNGEMLVYNVNPGVGEGLVGSNNAYQIDADHFFTYASDGSITGSALGSAVPGPDPRDPSMNTQALFANRSTFRPLAILGPTTKPTVALIGDSRGAGLGDDYSDGAGFVGNMERWIGPQFGYLQLCRSRETLSGFLNNASRRLQLAGLCSHVVENLAGNDILGNVADVAIEAAKPLLWNMIGKPLSRIFTMTLEPATSSPDFWTTSNQGAASIQSVLRNVNTFIRSNGSVGCFDNAKAVEPPWSSPDPENLSWNVPTYSSSSLAIDPTNGEILANPAGVPSAPFNFNLGCTVSVPGAGGFFPIDRVSSGGTQIRLYGSGNSSGVQATSSLAVSLCSSQMIRTSIPNAPNSLPTFAGAGINDGIHPNSTGYQMVASYIGSHYAIDSSGLFGFYS